MKKLLIILLATFVAVPVFSQLKFGIKAGVSTTSITMDDIKSISSSTASYTVEKLEGAKYGFHGGLTARLSIWKLYIQPELLFATRTNAYTVTNVTTSTVKDVTQSMNKLDIPVMVGLKLGPLRVNAGPSGSLLIGTPKELIDDPNLKSMYANMTIGYQAGVGLDILKTLTLDVRYEGSLKKYQTQIENLTGTTFNLDDRPNALLFSVGLMF
jgi:hypothetical protein